MQYWIHHLNDLSGSPLVLSEKLKSINDDENITLITNQGTGFLSCWKGRKKIIPYNKHDGKIKRFFSLSVWYFRTVWYLLIHLKNGDHLKLSTLVSSPLLLVQKLRPVVSAEILVNEVFFRVPFWRTIGIRLANSESVDKSYLSRFVRDYWGFAGSAEINYPSLRSNLLELSDRLGKIPPKNRNALDFFLVGSYIEAKGYKLFIDIARFFEMMENDHRFHLYLAGNHERFSEEFPISGLPSNLIVTFNNSSPDIFSGHDILLGLTNTDQWIETFGQTFAEAMMMGNITVVPPVGAQLEYITDGDNGFVFNDYSVAGIVEQINRILQHDDLAVLAERSRSSIRNFYDLK